MLYCSREERGQCVVQFDTWCDADDTPVAPHHVRTLTVRQADLPVGVNRTAQIVPTHYASEERIARAYARLAKPQAAALVTELLPQTPQMRSGDLGEIYATEWINAHSGYRAPINRLRWKDHRHMAMRGDDVIGIFQDPASQRLSFLKTESKSRINLTAGVVQEARNGLDKDGGLPSPHALSFVSSRLLDLNLDLALVDAIDDAQRVHGIPAHSVRHLLFTFSGNAPGGLLRQSFQAYGGAITQWGVGLHVQSHAAFIGTVYGQVIANANNA
ncbi:hypothetical protein D3C71_181950 [compost metagenome]